MGEAVSIAANVFSALGAAGNFILFLSQVPLMRRIFQEKDSTKYSYLPSVALIATLSLWSAYTIFVIPTPQLLAANFSGVGIPMFYIGIFMWFSQTWLRRVQIFAITLTALAVAWGVALGILLGGVKNGGSVVGWITAVVNCGFFVSPLKRLYEAVREMDISRVPTLLTYVQLVQPLVWVIAAALLNDPFILGVNAIGLTFAWIQFFVIQYIKCRRAAIDKAKASADPDGEVEAGPIKPEVAGAPVTDASSAENAAAVPAGDVASEHAATTTFTVDAELSSASAPTLHADDVAVRVDSAPQLDTRTQEGEAEQLHVAQVDR